MVTDADARLRATGFRPRRMSTRELLELNSGPEQRDSEDHSDDPGGYLADREGDRYERSLNREWT